MKLYYKESNIKIYNVNAITFLKELLPETIDCVITSPPYWALRDYGVEGQLGLEPTFQEYITKLCDIFDEVKRVLKKSGTCWVNIGDTYSAPHTGGRKSSKSTVGANRPEAQEFKQVKIHNFPDKCLLQIPSRFSIEMTNRGWILRNELIWFKPNCMPSSVRDRFTVDFEKIFFFVKNKKYWFERQFEQHLTNLPVVKKKQIGTSQTHEKDPWGSIGYGEQGRNKRCVWKITTKPFKEAHFAVFPEELVETPIKAGCPKFVCNKCGNSREKILKPTEEYAKYLGKGNLKEHHAGQETKEKFKVKVNAEYKHTGYTSCSCNAGFSGGIVLDPFMGSGTVAVVAKRLNRQFVGIDIKEDYVKMAIKRIQNTQRSFLCIA